VIADIYCACKGDRRWRIVRLRESAISSAPRRESVSYCAGILKYPQYIEPPVSGVRVTVCNTWTVPAPKGAAEIYIRAEGLKSEISGLPFTPSAGGWARHSRERRLWSNYPSQSTYASHP
jgi:hypothetical protein